MMAKRIFSFVLILLSLLFLLPVSVSGAEMPDLSVAKAVYFSHLQSGTEVLTQNETEVRKAGSTVKAMSGLVLCELFLGREEETVIVSSSMLPASLGYSFGFPDGTAVSVKDLLYAAICGGYNDAYYILVSYYTNGNSAVFLAKMNERGKSIGLKNTVFSDFTGLEDASVTTAEDLAAVAMSAYRNKTFLTIASTEKYTMSVKSQKGNSSFENRNKLVSSERYYEEGCLGISAGSTKSAGDCLVSIVDRTGSEGYVCVVLGCETDSNLQYTLANKLLKWAYSSHVNLTVIDQKKALCEIPVSLSEETSSLPVKTDESYSAFLPLGAEVGKDVILNIRLDQDSLTAPVEDHTKVGSVAVLYNGTTLKTLPLYTDGSAQKSGLLSKLFGIKALTEGRGLRAGLVFFVLSIGAWVGIEFYLSYKKKHKWDKYFSTRVDYESEKKSDTDKKE